MQALRNTVALYQGEYMPVELRGCLDAFGRPFDLPVGANEVTTRLDTHGGIRSCLAFWMEKTRLSLDEWRILPTTRSGGIGFSFTHRDNTLLMKVSSIVERCIPREDGTCRNTLTIVGVNLWENTECTMTIAWDRNSADTAYVAYSLPLPS